MIVVKVAFRGSEVSGLGLQEIVGTDATGVPLGLDYSRPNPPGTYYIGP